MSLFTVVVNDCAAAAVVGGPIAVRTRDTPHGSQNFVLNFTNLVAGLPRQLTDSEMDWIETVGHLFAIDLACERGNGDLSWTRSIVAHLPVRDPDLWNSIAPQIQRIFGDFTGDRLEAHFLRDPAPVPAPRQRSTAFPDHDCVSLVSGGVDSFIGTADLIDSGRRPLAVSHTAAASISHAQNDVEDVLRQRLPDLERLGLTAKKHGNTFPHPEPSQRSRSLLFLGAACLVAAVGGRTEVFINENGVMAIQLPMTAARIGSLTTHTAAPTILERIESLSEMVLGARIDVRNRLLSMTKPEVVDLGVRLGLANDLVQTVSCWSIGRTSHHCGVCLPCLMRRISCEIHRVADVTYAADAFNDVAVLSQDFACDNLTHLVRLVDQISSASDLALQIDYPEVLNGGSQLSVTNTIELHRRWADQAASIIFAKPIPASLR